MPPERSVVIRRGRARRRPGGMGGYPGCVHRGAVWPDSAYVLLTYNERGQQFGSCREMRAPDRQKGRRRPSHTLSRQILRGGISPLGRFIYRGCHIAPVLSYSGERQRTSAIGGRRPDRICVCAQRIFVLANQGWGLLPKSHYRRNHFLSYEIPMPIGEFPRDQAPPTPGPPRPLQ